MKECELIAAAIAGSETAYQTLYNSTKTLVYKRLLFLTGNESDAEDLMQETFIKAFTKLSSFRGDSAFSSWVYRIACNEYYMRARRGKDRSFVSIEDDTIKQHLHTSHNHQDFFLAKLLEEAIEELPRRQRQTFLLHNLWELKHREVAAQLDLSVGSVKSYQSRACNSLREIISI